MTLRAHSPETIDVEIPRRRPTLVQWGASFAGAISAIALAAMFSALWWAIGYGSGVSFVAHNLSWFFLATVLGSLLAGGAVAGRVAGLRGVATGAYDGLAVWALTVIAVLIPLSLRGVALANAGAAQPAATTAFNISSGDAWALFGAIVGGLASALVGSTTGAATPRIVGTATDTERVERSEMRRSG